MVEPITAGTLGTAALKGAAGAAGAYAGKKLAEAASKEIDKGWQKDYEAGGISSLGNKRGSSPQPV